MAVFCASVCEDFQQAKDAIRNVLRNADERELKKVLERIDGYQKKIVAVLPAHQRGTALEATIAWRKEKGKVWLFLRVEPCSHVGSFGVIFESKFAYYDLAVAFPKLKQKMFELCTRFLRVKGYAVPSPVVFYDYSEMLDAFAAYDEEWYLWLVTKETCVVVDTYPKREASVENIVIHLQRSHGMKISLTKEALQELIALIVAKKLIGL